MELWCKENKQGAEHRIAWGEGTRYRWRGYWRIRTHHRCISKRNTGLGGNSKQLFLKISSWTLLMWVYRLPNLNYLPVRFWNPKVGTLCKIDITLHCLHGTEKSQKLRSCETGKCESTSAGEALQTDNVLRKRREVKRPSQMWRNFLPCTWAHNLMKRPPEMHTSNN